MRNKLLKEKAASAFRRKPRAKIRPPPPPRAVIRVTNHIAHLGGPKQGPKTRQLLSLPPFPGHPLPGRKSAMAQHVTAISWLKYYFDDIPPPAIRNHFNKGLVHMECYQGDSVFMRKINPCDIMEEGAKVHIPASVVESRISKRFDVIPRGTLNPNADEIEYLRRLVKYKDSAILLLNKPPKLPLKGSVTVHNSMDALAAAALSYDYEEGPKLVHRLDRESSGLLLMGRTKDSISYLHWLFSDVRKTTKSPLKDWSHGCETMYRKYWALVIGSPKEKEGLISAPLTKVLLDDGETARVILSHKSGLEASEDAITEYRVLGPTINGCSWIELRPLTSRKHQIRVHCAEALGTPIVGDYKYGWFVHNRWKRMGRLGFEASAREICRSGLDVQKGSVLSKVPLLHLHCREMVVPNVAKMMECGFRHGCDDEDVMHFVGSMPSHMKISWNLMSSCLV